LTTFKLGLNLICAGNRFPEPEAWSQLAREELDLDYVQFSTDVLDPLWPEAYVRNYLERTKACLEKYNLVIESVFGGLFARRHMLLHPDQGGREMWFEWYKALIRLAVFIGGKSIGTHFGTLSMKDASDPVVFEQRIEEGIRRWQELSRYGKERGLEHLYFETMSIQREMASTIEGAKMLYQRVNKNSAIPMLMCLDIGHAPHPTERDPYLWLRELSPYASLVHLQQTEANHSRHWPFTPEYNAIGIIDPPKVLETISTTGVKEMPLYFEIFHRETEEQEKRVIPELRESVLYWRKYLAGYQEIRLAEQQMVAK
jgi:sugar phosphate isomerase/epimerase